jgi:RNA polymerase sigma-70 factor (ECF subfamily)
MNREKMPVSARPALAQPPRAYDADDDVALVQALREGRSEAVTVLWQRHANMVRGILRRLLGPDQDVEDLLQETFIQFFRQVHALRDPRALRMFLIKITTNVVRGELRGRRVRRVVRPTDSGALPDIPVRELDVDARHALHKFYGILDELSPYERTTFVLRFIEDMDLTDVAEAVGVSLATIKRHLAKVSDRVFARVDGDAMLRDFLGRRADKRAENGAVDAT